MAAAPANGAENNNTSILDEISARAPSGTLLPPRNIREIVEKTAGYVARSGARFEDRLRTTQAENAKMSFIYPDDAYHAYYQWRIEDIKAGNTNALSSGRENEAQGAGVSTKGREERRGPTPPEEFRFSARMPNINAQDLDVVKLTALFVAKNGRSWMGALAQREAGNFQFDFLRPQHSLYQFFSRLVDQYTDLLTGDSVDGGRPQKKRMTELQQNVDDRFHVLARAKKRGEWVRYQEAQKVAKEESDEKERITYAQIDWHDFVVVETLIFDESDANAELPPPYTLNDLQSSSLEQKAARRIDSSRRIEEAMPTFNDQDQFYGNQPAQTQPTAPPVQIPHHPASFPVDDVQVDRARARAAQEAAARNPNVSALKIRSDYVPRAQAKKQAQNTSICQICGLAIPNDEIAEHIRIEMLDPQWREQSRINQQRSSTTNLSTQDVANNLKRLASQRSDVFDPVTGQALTEEEQVRRKRAELGAYDGVSQPAQGFAASGGVAGQDGTQSTDVQEQIRQLHNRYKT